MPVILRAACSQFVFVPIYVLTLYLVPLYRELAKSKAYTFKYIQAECIKQAIALEWKHLESTSLAQDLIKYDNLNFTTEQKLSKPTKFWETTQQFDEPMRKFAMAVISLKGQGTPVESFFSSLSYQKPKIRNRLTFDNLKIISTIRKNLKRSVVVTAEDDTKMPSKKANNNSRKRAKTTGVDMTTTANEDDDRQQGRKTTTTASSSITSRHVQDSFHQEQPDGGDWTRSDDARNLLNQVVKAGAATATVQDINFEDKFKQILRDVEQEGMAENADVAFYNKSSDEEDDKDNNNRQGQQQQEEQP